MRQVPIDIVKLCQDYFDFDLPSVMLEKGRKTFLARFDTVEKKQLALACT